MKRILPALMMVLMMIPVVSLAFDGERKGFAVGGGLGVAPVAQFKTVDNYGRSAGMALQFVIGYAWNSHNMAVLEVNGASYSNSQFNLCAVGRPRPPRKVRLPYQMPSTDRHRTPTSLSIYQIKS